MRRKVARVEINTEDLVTIAQAYQKLGVGYSRSSILRRIKSGEWIEGVHYINDARTNSNYRIIKINIRAVQELRKTNSGER
jgi:hypothetical protein